MGWCKITPSHDWLMGWFICGCTTLSLKYIYMCDRGIRFSDKDKVVRNYWPYSLVCYHVCIPQNPTIKQELTIKCVWVWSSCWSSPQMWNHGPHSERPGTPSAKSAASASARMHSCYRSWPRREPWKWGCFTRAACATPAAVQKRQQRSFQISICIRSWTIQAEDHARGRREEQFFLSKGLPYTHESLILYARGCFCSGKPSAWTSGK